MLDPPRDGVNPKALMKILNFGVERLVYIACKPTSLARDLEMIQGRGYKVEKISGVDLFRELIIAKSCVVYIGYEETHSDGINIFIQ